MVMYVVLGFSANSYAHVRDFAMISFFSTKGNKAKCEPNTTFHSTVWGSCRNEHYSAKSYVRHLVDGKYKLIVGSSHVQHVLVIKGLQAAITKGHDKATLTALRSALEEHLS